MKRVFWILFVMACLSARAQIAVSLPENSDENETAIALGENEVRLVWPVKNSEECQLVLNLTTGTPLFGSIAMGRNGNLAPMATDVDPVFLLNVGSRTLKPENGWTIFFDKVPERPYTAHVLEFDKREMKISKHGKRTVISVSDISAPDFEGSLEITIYNGVPLFNIAAVISTQKDSTAILYDAGLTSTKPWNAVAYSDTSDNLVKISTSSNSEILP